MPMVLELPNKELTPQMERHGGGGGEGRGWCEGEKEGLVAGAKVVSSGLWNQELFALYSATPLHYRHRNTHTSTHALYQVRPLLRSGLAGMLTFTRTHPRLHFSPLLLLQNREKIKGKQHPLLQSAALCDQRSACECESCSD